MGDRRMEDRGYFDAFWFWPGGGQLTLASSWICFAVYLYIAQAGAHCSALHVHTLALALIHIDPYTCASTHSYTYIFTLNTHLYTTRT